MKHKIAAMRDQALLHHDALEHLASTCDEPAIKAELLDAVKTSADHTSALNHVLHALV